MDAAAPAGTPEAGSSTAPRPVEQRDVFINVPFDEEYEPLYLALISGLVGLGLLPRCVVEVEGDGDRLSRILDLVLKCPFSVHDLSRVGLTKVGDYEVPRFNMPFELGLCAMARHMTEKRHQFRVFESQRYRLSASLSDIGGYNEYVHHGTPKGLLQCLTNCFQNIHNPPMRRPKDLFRVFKRLEAVRHSDLRGQDVYQPFPFRELVVAARAIVEQLVQE